jgi:hypothetical protein
MGKPELFVILWFVIVTVIAGGYHFVIRPVMNAVDDDTSPEALWEHFGLSAHEFTTTLVSSSPVPSGPYGGTVADDGHDDELQDVVDRSGKPEDAQKFKDEVPWVQ